MNTDAPKISDLLSRSADSDSSLDSQLETLGEPQLITDERAGAFELLVYLIANLKSPLLVYGPPGIGKTRVLHMIKDRYSAGCTVCYIGATNIQKLAQIEKRLLTAASKATEIESGTGLEQCLRNFAGKNRQLVALIDNAVSLPGGHLDTLYDFADKHAALRLVLAMTSEEVDRRKTTDPMLAKYHIVEIPPLNAEQCGEFLQRIYELRSQPETSEPISKALKGKIFRNTLGIPGRIISTLIRIEALKVQDRKSKQLMTYGGISAGIIIAVVLLFLMNTLTAEDEKNREPAGVALNQTDQIVDRRTAGNKSFRSIEKNGEGQPPRGSADLINQMSTSSTKRVLPKPDSASSVAARVGQGKVIQSTDSNRLTNEPNERPITRDDTVKNLIARDAALALSDTNDPGSVKSIEVANRLDSDNSRDSDLTIGKKRPTEQSEVTRDIWAARENPLQREQAIQGAEIESVKNKFAAAGLKSEDWLLGRNPNAYTLQILADKKPDRLIAFATQHPEFVDLAYFRTRKNGSEWLALVYGTFTSLPEANRAASTLPADLGKPWTRTFKEIHQKIHSLQRN